MAGVEERRQMLFDDPDLALVEAHRVYCMRCEKWLKLDEAKLYAASVWRCHKGTKSHIARTLASSASAPPPPKRDVTSGLPGRQNSSASGSMSRDPREDQEILTKASLSRRAPSGDHSRLRSADSSPSSASAPVIKSLPRLKLKVPVSTRSDAASASTSTSGAVSSASRSELTPGAAPLTSTTTVAKPRPSSSISHPTGISQPTSSKSDTPQRSMPPPALSPSINRVTGHPPSHSTQAGSSTSSQPANLPQSQLPGASKSSSRVRSASSSGKDVEPSSASTSVPRASLPLEPMSPHRKASYKALINEPYIGKLEPFRAFCTLCNRWVDLSSRTPYSYGVWKGHARKNDKHTRLEANNAEDDYDTASEHSQEESGVPSNSDPVANAQKKAGVNGRDGTVAASTSVSRTESEGGPPHANGKDITDKSLASPDFSQVENGRLRRRATASSSDLQDSSAPAPQDEVSSSSVLPNPFALKATNEDSFGPRHQAESSEPSRSKGSQVSLFEADEMPILTESSEEEPSSSQAPQKMTPATALAKRRDAMLADPDAAIVESRRVQCRLCERWIKGSNTQEYSSHHWLKHKKKCSRTRARESDRWSEPAEARKARLEADSDLETLEPHRALCRLCNKWVKLCGRSRYSASHWVQHKRKCPILQTKFETAAQAELSEAAVSAQSMDEKQSISKQSQAASTPESRRAALQADPNIVQLFPDRVQCKACNRWIKLSMPVEYSPGHWLNHKECCPGQATDSTSKLQAALEARRKTLEEDPDVAELEPHRVHCARCGSWVKLRQDCSYSLGKWQTHKKRCGQQSRGMQAGSGADAEPTVKLSDQDVDDLGDDDREAMDVEDALQADLEGGGDTSREFGLHEISGDAGSSSTHSGRKTRTEHTEDGSHKNDLKAHNELSYDVDGDGDVDMTGTEADRGDRGEDSRGDGEREGWNREQTTIAEQQAGETRRLELLADPDALKVEPQRVLCRLCVSWVGLEGPCSYKLAHWRSHKQQCPGGSNGGNKSTDVQMLNNAAHEPLAQLTLRRKDGRSMAPSGSRLDARSSRPIHALPKGKGKAVAAKRARSPLTLPPAPLRPRWPDEDERKQQFVDDPNVLRVEPHRLLCKHCNCWIRLHPIIRYSQSIWPQHKASCKDVLLLVPGDAKVRAKSEKEEARRQLLEEDPYATDVGPHRVTCKACETNIRLDTTYKFEGSHWRAHRARCSKIPFHERMPKKRRVTEQVQEPVVVSDSSDSDDSDASSAPRPRPTSFFTEPLVVKPTEMFKRRSRAVGPPAPDAAAVAATKAQAEAHLMAHLQELAAELDASDRLTAIIQSAGDGIMSEERFAEPQLQHHQEVDAQAEGNDEEFEDGGVPSLSRLSPSPDPETWIPSKRTREEEDAFDSFFNDRPLPPTPPRPKGRVRVCKLGKEGMRVVD